MTRRKKPTASPPEPAVEELDAGTEIDARDVLPPEPEAPATPPAAARRARSKKKETREPAAVDAPPAALQEEPAPVPASATDDEPAADAATADEPPTPPAETLLAEEPARPQETQAVDELVQAAATVVKRRRAKKPPETEAERNAAAIARARAAIVGAAPADDANPAADDAVAPEDEPPFAPPQRDDVETTVNLVGDELPLPGRDDLDPPTLSVRGDQLEGIEQVVDQRQQLRGLLEALVFASDVPVKTTDLVTVAEASYRQVQDALDELVTDYAGRGIHLEEVNGGWVFRTSAKFAHYVRDLTKQRPVRLSRAQVEALAIIAYRQPITRPEIDDVRGVDSGPVLKVLLERDLVRILGKRDEVGRPLIYGTTNAFLEFFGLKSLKDLPTLREFTELTEESREAYEDEMGEPPNDQTPSDDDPPAQAAEEGTTEDEDVEDQDDDDDTDDDDDDDDDDE